jgi:transmembrane sensor
MSQSGPPLDEGLFAEAAAWFARMRGPDADASRADFEAWLSRGALHRAAYNRAAEIFAMGKFLAEEQADDPPRPARFSSAGRLWLGAAAAAALLVLTAGWTLSHNAFPHWPDLGGRARPASRSVEVTELSAAAEPQSIRLADGSLVKLEAGTSIAVDLGRQVRRLTLDRGSARFFVAHEIRPFVVLAGGGAVTAHGTIFDVGLEDRRVSVRLIEGSIDVALPAALGRSATGGRRRLRMGEAISFPASPPAPGIAAASDAPQGKGRGSTSSKAVAQEVDGVPLADVIAAANRTSARPIRLADPSLGGRRVSGYFRIDDSDLLADRIASLFNLAVDRTEPGEIILKPR